MSVQFQSTIFPNIEQLRFANLGSRQPIFQFSSVPLDIVKGSHTTRNREITTDRSNNSCAWRNVIQSVTRRACICTTTAANSHTGRSKRRSSSSAYPGGLSPCRLCLGSIRKQRLNKHLPIPRQCEFVGSTPPSSVRVLRLALFGDEIVILQRFDARPRTMWPPCHVIGPHLLIAKLLSFCNYLPLE